LTAGLDRLMDCTAVPARLGLKELFDVIEATPQIKAICWFQWGKQWNVERDAGQLAEYQRRLQAARFRVPFAGTKP